MSRDEPGKTGHTATPSGVASWLFLVNGGESSAAGERARAFACRLPEGCRTQILYRPLRKWQGITPMARMARRTRPDIVYVMDTAYTGVLAARLAKMGTGCRWITDTGDAAYELARSCGTYSRSGLALIRTIENLAMRGSDGVVVRGSKHRGLLTAQGIANVEWVPDGIDYQAVSSAATKQARNAFRAAHDLNGSLVVGLVGSMNWDARHEMCYGWDIVEALSHLRDRPVRALLVGDGDGKARLQARAAALGVADRIIWTGRMSYGDLPPAIAAMDVCVSTQSNDIVGQVRTTGKLPLYLACGRYVIATDVGEASRVLPGIGGLLPYSGVRDDTHPARLAAHLEAVQERPALLDCGYRAHALAAREFDYDILAQRVLAFGNALCKRR